MKRQLVGQLQKPGERPQNINLVLDRLAPALLVEPFTDADATPSVKSNDNHNIYTTANTGATTITDFDDGFVGQTINVVIGDANTAIDFTSTNLKNDSGSDWSPSSGDYLRAIYDGTYWYCTAWDASAGGSSGETNYVSTDQTSTTSTLANFLTGFTDLDASSWYKIEGYIAQSTTDATVDVDMRPAFGSAPTDCWWSANLYEGVSGGADQMTAQYTADLRINLSNTNRWAGEISGYIQTNAATSLAFQFGRNGVTGTVTIYDGSWVTVTKMS